MAESVVKLRLDSNEYDSKIKRAAQNVLEFGQNCQKAGQSVSKADKETLEYVQAIGKMETVAKNAKGKIGEMTSAFTELSVQYRHLTDQEKQSPFGKALAQSLDQLRQRINDSKSELDDVNRSLQGTSSQGEQTGGIMQQLASKFTVNVDAIKLLNIGLSATKMALDVAKDAFFASESSADEWGRIIESGRAIYDSFLQTLNNGNFSNFFANLDNVIAKARAAADAIDDLNTAMTIINPERAKLQTRQTQLQSVIRREGANSEAGRRAQEELKALEPRLQASYRTESGMNWNAFTALVDEKLASAGINLDKNSRDFLLRSFHSMDDYELLKRNARGSRTYQAGQSIGTTSYGALVSNGRWVDTRNTNQKLLDLFTDDWRQQNSGYLTASFNALGQSYGMLRGNARYLNSGTGGGGSRGGTGRGGTTTTAAPPPVGSIAEQEAKVQALTKAWREATDEVGRAGYAGQLEEAKQVLDQMQGKTKEVIPEGSFKDLKNQLSELQKQRELLADPVEVAIIDTDIERVKDQIDELNGKLKEVENTEPISLEEKIRTSISEDKINADMQALTNLLRVKIENGLDDLDIPAEHLQRAILGGEGFDSINIPDEYWQALAEQINEKLKELGIDPIAIDVQTGNVSKEEKDRRSPMDTMRAAMGGISQIAGGINQMGVKLPESINQGISVMQGVISVIEGVQTVISLFSSGSQALNTAAVTANTVALGALTTAMTVNTATNFIPFFNTGGIAHAAGGLLTGHHYSGDQVPVMVNDGELILNRAQQGNIASQLEGGGGLANLQLEAKISAESLRILLNSNSRRRGRGEYVTSKSKG